MLIDVTMKLSYQIKSLNMASFLRDKTIPSFVMKV